MPPDPQKNVVFLIQPPGPYIEKADRLSRRAIINRQIAIHRHVHSSKRKASKDSSTSPESVPASSGDAEVTELAIRKRRPAADRKRRGNARKQPDRAEDEPWDDAVPLETIRSASQSTTQSPQDTSLLPLSTVGSSLFVMDESKSRIFSYYVRYWMPTPDEVPFACQIAGFTPVWPGDQTLSIGLLSEALQSDSMVSIYSLLTVCARRMRVINGVQGGLDLPEVYAAKAISSLLEVIKEKGHLTQRLILDISYLVLSEVYVKMHKKPEVYGQMLKDLIIHFGGIQNINGFTAFACMGWDNLISSTTLVLPALDPFRSPELFPSVMVASTISRAELMQQIYCQIQNLEPRAKSMAMTSNAFSNVITALQIFPEHVQTCIRLLARNSSPKIFRVLTVPFLYDKDTAYGSQEDAAVAKLDVDMMFVKTHSYLVWLWYSALGTLGYEPDVAQELYPPPYEVSQLDIVRLTLDNILSSLERTNWHAHYPLVLWIAAVLALVNDGKPDYTYWTSLMAKTATRLGVATVNDLNMVLVGHPSLQLVSKHMRVTAWDILAQHYAQTPSSSSSARGLDTG
ncbi:hypothetical protein B0A52_04061 [Exophiala mesophila]|uniref:Uncharacterized protein n=1 Tax=Exophiala mesophila TaxID=212818 RepID=A0A438NAK9_EXOME|nr:hypothetical protein B0A52_04061 [Exophiala mesophila]